MRVPGSFGSVLGRTNFRSFCVGLSLGRLFHQRLAEHVLIQAAFAYGRVAVDDGKGIPVAIAPVGIAAEAGCSDAGKRTCLAKDAVVEEGSVHAVYQRATACGMPGGGQGFVDKYLLDIGFSPCIAQEGKQEVGSNHVLGG